MPDVKLRRPTSVSFGDLGVYDGQTAPVDAEVLYEIRADGYVWTATPPSAAVQGNKWFNYGDKTDYEVMFTQIGGSGGVLTGETLDTWVQIGIATRWLDLLTTGTADNIRNFKVRVRRKSTSTPTFSDIQHEYLLDLEADTTV